MRHGAVIVKRESFERIWSALDTSTDLFIII